MIQNIDYQVKKLKNKGGEKTDFKSGSPPSGFPLVYIHRSTRGETREIVLIGRDSF